MVMIHPLHPLGLDRMGGRPELAAVAAFPLETAFAAVSLMTSGVTERFSKTADIAEPRRWRIALDPATAAARQDHRTAAG